jgi:hypothetical protein
MPDSTELASAELRELDAELRNEINEDKWVRVQFNPETLKVTFTNQVATPQGSGDQNGTAARLFVGSGTTKLALQLVFDVNAPLPEGQEAVTDVRQLTEKVGYFITPEPQGEGYIPPAVRFLWGSFKFDGIMDSLDETLELFSHDGKPLRASMSISMSQQKIPPASSLRQPSDTASSGSTGPAAGSTPHTPAPAGATLQGMTASRSRGGDWRRIAQANGIENPRMLQPGQLINMSPARSAFRR